MPSPSMPIAVVGVGAIVPGAGDAAGFWNNVREGRDFITDVPSTHWLIDDYYDPNPAAPDKTYCRRGAFLSPTAFDALENGIPPSNLPATDTAQLLALVVARQVLEDAAVSQRGTIARDRISVILGVTGGTGLLGHMVSRLQRPIWQKALRESGLSDAEVQAACDRIADSFPRWQEASFPGLLGNVVAGRIANRLDLGGTNSTVDAACASSLSAVSMAVNELYLGQSDLAVVGGVDTCNDILMYMCFSKTPALSKSGDCRPFSARADGTMMGEGIGMLALRRLEDAERDGDPIYAVLKGIGTSSDGKSKSVYAPVPAGQAKALRRAYAAAGYGPETVELVEAHGTGTVAGDAAEFQGLCDVFNGSGRADRQWCALGSVKSQIGHTKAAAGAIGLLKAVLALHHRVLPPTIKIDDEPNPALDLKSSPFYLNTQPRPWVANPAHPRRASVSSFGFGGSNFHLTLEEYLGPNPRPARYRSTAAELFLFSGAGAAEVAASCRALAAEVPGALARVARKSRGAFDPEQPARLAIVASDEADFTAKAQRTLERLGRADGARAFEDPTGVYFQTGPAAGPVAFLFPGQGSQYVGMGADVANEFDLVREAWEEGAREIAREGTRLTEVVFPRPAFTASEREEQEARLTSTAWAQPAIGVASLGYLRILSELGVTPMSVGGHSFGELTGLHAAGVLDARDFLVAARERGRLMEAAAKLPGTMSAVVASVDEVRSFLAESGARVVVANANEPRQTVVSGGVEEIAAFEAFLERKQVAFKRLRVATAFHSPIVEQASGAFADALAPVKFRPAQVPVFSNSEAGPYPSADADASRQLLAGQLSRPVRFVEQVRAMYDAGARVFVEVGPGAVLTQLTQKCLEGRPHQAISLDRRGQRGLVALFQGLARLSVAGVKLDFERLFAPFRSPAEPAPKKPGATYPIIGATYGKPYPENVGNGQVPRPPPAPVRAPVAPAAKANTVPPPPAAAPPAKPIAVPPARMPAPSPSPVTPPPAASPIRPSALPPASMPVRGSSMSTQNPSSSPSWLPVFAEIQRQTAEAHQAHERAMTEGHLAYLRTMETLLVTLAGGTPAPRATAPVLPAPAPSYAVPPAPVAALHHPAPPAPAPMAMPTPSPAPMPAPPVVVAPVAAPVVPVVAVPAPAPASAADGPALSLEDLKARMLTIVAEKTGYPRDIINLEMDMEAELGIDSIKRVEILAAFREATPGMPEVKGKEMATFRTLAEVVTFIESTLGPRRSLQRSVAAAPEASVGRYVVREAEAPAAPGRPLSKDWKLAVTDDARGVGRALVRELRAAGHVAELASSPDELPADTRGIVFLKGLDSPGDDRVAEAWNGEAFRFAKRLAPAAGEHGGVFITVQDTGGDFGLSGRAGKLAWGAGLPGLVKTVAQEWPAAVAKAIDLEIGSAPVDALAARLLREILSGGPEREVGLRADGRRTTLAADLVPLRRPATPVQRRIDRQGVVVASGGARGVTATALIALARDSQPRIALIGRSPLVEEPAHVAGATGEDGIRRALLEAARASGAPVSPRELQRQASAILNAREVRGTLSALAEAGSEAAYFAADIQDGASIREALAAVRARWGAITAIVHGAGVLADKLIADKTVEQFEQVFSVKVAGLRNLLEATDQDPLRAICLFSSIAARAGNAGQADYAMANEVLNKVAAAEARRRGAGCVVKSLNWGPWEGGMVKPALAEHFRRRGVSLIPLAQGAQAFVDEMQHGPAEIVEIVLGGDPRAGLHPEALAG